MRQPSLPSLEEEPPPLKILVAEDNLMNQKVMIRSLNMLGHQDVQIAKDGKQTLEAIEKDLPDLILMDVQMPIYDGVTCTKMIREKYGPWPFIVSITANYFPEDKANCLNAGMNAFLTKPVRIDQVRQVVQECQLAKRTMFPPKYTSGPPKSVHRQITRTSSAYTFKNPLAKPHPGLPQSRSYDTLKNPFRKHNENNNAPPSHLETTQILRNSMDFYKKLRKQNLDGYRMTTTPPSPPGSNQTSDTDESDELNEINEDDENENNENENNENENDNDNENDNNYTNIDSLSSTESTESSDSPDNPRDSSS